MATLKDGLQKNDLLFSLKKKYLRDFADLLAWAEGYARAEEAFKMKDDEAAKEWQVGDSSKPAAEHVLELSSDTSMSRLLPGLVGREAQIAKFSGALPREDFIATPLSTHQKPKC